MSDLISRSALMEKSFVLEGHRVVSYVDLIEAPTAYDVEKVAEELSSNSRFVEDINEHNIKRISCVIGQKTAIDIVKKGGAV